MGTALYCCKTRLDHNNNIEIKCNISGEKSIDETVNSEKSKQISDNSDFRENRANINMSDNIKILKLQKKIREFLFRIQKRRLLGSYFSNINSYQTPKLGFPIEQYISNMDFVILNSPNSKYIGENSKKNIVFGIKINKNGSKYIGNWKDKLQIGLGIMKNINGNVFKGEFLNGKQSGYGYLLQLNGKIFEGQFLDDVHNGYGIEKSYDKSNYTGEFYNGKKHGIGKWIGNDGSIYEGEFKDNLKNGYGIHHFKDGSNYQGEWMNNSLDGYGEFYFSDGKIYIGFHKNDKKHGFGFFLWVDGRTFIGNWKNGKQHGLGKYIVEGISKFGIWIDGERISWYNSREEAFNQIQIDDFYTKFYSYNRKDIENLINIS